VLLRLLLEIAELFEEWLQAHFPQRAEHVMSLVRQCRGGQNYDGRFGTRMRGEGPFAELLARRFQLACRRLGLDRRELGGLDCSRFSPPGAQLALWWSEAAQAQPPAQLAALAGPPLPCLPGVLVLQ